MTRDPPSCDRRLHGSISSKLMTGDHPLSGRELEVDLLKTNDKRSSFA